MSHSRRKHPFCGYTTAESEKDDKRRYNRRYRRVCRQILHSNPEREILPVLKEVSDIWWMDKDGKGRFNPKLHPELLRK